MRRLKALHTLYYAMWGKRGSHREVLTLYYMMTDKDFRNPPLVYYSMD
jgi:hypothetical protein